MNEQRGRTPTVCLLSALLLATAPTGAAAPGPRAAIEEANAAFSALFAKGDAAGLAI